MFERYTEKARRVIFFARKEASEFGSPAIESEHLLLALLREGKAIGNRYALNEEEIRAAIAKSAVSTPPISTSVDLPLSDECRHILYLSAEEAERLVHKHIGTEHLLVGILREENCLAAQLLRERGLTLERASAVFAETQDVAGGRIGSGAGSARFLPPIKPTTINVVDAESSEVLLSYHHSALIPGVGHTILIHQKGGPDIAYQVNDVVWEFDSSLKRVVVSVHKGVGKDAPSGRGDSPANVTQPRRPNMGSGSGAVRPEREFEG